MKLYSNAAGVFFILVMIVLFVGTTSLHDVIISWLSNKCAVTP